MKTLTQKPMCLNCWKGSNRPLKIANLTFDIEFHMFLMQSPTISQKRKTIQLVLAQRLKQRKISLYFLPAVPIPRFSLWMRVFMMQRNSISQFFILIWGGTQKITLRRCLQMEAWGQNWFTANLSAIFWRFFELIPHVFFRKICWERMLV